MEKFFLHLRTLEEMPIVSDMISDYGKIAESLVFVLPYIENNEINEIYIAALTVEMAAVKIEKIGRDKQIRESIKWMYYIEKKSLQLYDLLREVGFNGDDYKKWLRDRQPSEKFIELFDRNLGKDEKLTKLSKLIYFYLNTNFNNEATEKMIRYWFKIIEEGEEVFMRLPRDPEPIEDEELGLNSSFFIIKQKLALWIISRKQSEIERLEMLSEIYPKLDLNIKFVNDDSEILAQFGKFLFARFLASKNLPNLMIQNWMIREKVKCLELTLGAKIWIGHDFGPSLFDSQVLRKPVEREKWDSYIQKVFKESMDSFIAQTEENLEFLVAENAKYGRKRAELFLRIQYVSFLLAFNVNTKYQTKINSSLRTLKSSDTQLKSIQQNIFALELEHCSQLKNYKKIAIILSKLQAFEGIDVSGMVPSLLQRSPEKSMFIEEIDPKIFSVIDFSLKSYHYTDKGLELKILLEFLTEVSDLRITDVKLVLNTGTQDFPAIESEMIPFILLNNSDGSVDLTFLYPKRFEGNINFLTIQTIEFKFSDIQFRISDFPEIQNKNINIDDIPCVFVNSSGFLNRLNNDLVFFEENGPNFFFIEFSTFDNRNSKLANLVIDIQKSSKYLILNPEVKLFSSKGVKDLSCEFERIRFPEISGGRYVLVLTLYLLHSKMKNYKLKLNCQNNNKSVAHLLNLKTKNEVFYYLENQLQYVNETYSQLRVSNKTSSSINIKKINDTVFNPIRILRTNEELSLIVKNEGDTSIVYGLVGLKFQTQPIHATIQRFDPSLIKSGSEIEAKILRIEQFILNKDLNIRSMEIKNKKDVKIFEQNHFVLHYNFNVRKLSVGTDQESTVKRIYLELKWNREKYCIIGKHRFLLKCNAKEKRKEIAFIPFESGFLTYPQILLVETKADGSEIQHLLNENKHLKIFFVHENVIKEAQYAVKAPRIA